MEVIVLRKTLETQPAIRHRHRARWKQIVALPGEEMRLDLQIPHGISGYGCPQGAVLLCVERFAGYDVRSR